MVDFYEGWNLRNRLIHDGYLKPQDEVEDGIEMMRRVMDLAREHYGWEAAEPTDYKMSDLERDSLAQQTANDRVSYIWEIAVDYDGYRSYRGCAGLLDEIIGCTQVETKAEKQVLDEIEVFNTYKDYRDFFSIHKMPLLWSFPIGEWRKIVEWCDENNYSNDFLCLNHDDKGEVIAVAMRIDRK